MNLTPDHRTLVVAGAPERSLPGLRDIVTKIESKGAHLASLTEQIDTSTSSGRMVFHVMGALAQFERDLISERTKAGLQAARAEGVRLGRPPALTPRQITHDRKLIEAGESPPRVAKSLKVGASTLRAALAKDREREIRRGRKGGDDGC
jgi:DNA invertase Pin-like site-specific DNA recombinase